MKTLRTIVRSTTFWVLVSLAAALVLSHSRACEDAPEFCAGGVR